MYNLDTKPERCYKKGKLQINIMCEQRCKNPKQNINKLNPVIYKNENTLRKLGLSHEWKIHLIYKN